MSSSKKSPTTIKGARVKLARILLPPEDMGLFTPQDVCPKRGADHGSHIVKRDADDVRVLKTHMTAVMVRKGHTYRITRPLDAPEGAAWLAVARLDASGKIAAKI